MNLYAINSSSPAPYVPATWHGGWTTTPATAVYTKTIDTVKWALNGQSSVGVTGTGAGPLTVALRRFVSRRLAAQTFAGTFDVCLGALQALSTDEFVWKCYVWVSVGDSDVARGVALDYTEVLGVGGATAFPTTRTGKTFAAAQTLSSVSVQEGDRLIVEIGVSTTTATGGSHTASVEVGAWGVSGAAYASLAAAETPTTERAGFFTYSGTLTLSTTEPTNVSPDTATAITTVPHTFTVTPIYAQTELWYRLDAAADTVVGTFMGRSETGTYESLQTVWKGPVDASFEEYMLAAYGTADRPYVVPVLSGATMYFRSFALGSTSVATGTFVFDVANIPVLNGDLSGKILIQDDDTYAFPLAEQMGYVLDASTGDVDGVVLGIAPSENSAFIGPLQRWLTGNELALSDLLLYNSATFEVLTTVTGAVAALPTINTPICATADTFYVAQYRVDLGGIVKLQAISPEGVLGATWDMDGAGGVMWGLAVSPNNATAYYTRPLAGQPVKRWDLVNDVALSDLAAGSVDYLPTDVMTLTDGSVLVLWYGAVSSGPAYVARYSADGTLLFTYDPKTDLGLPTWTLHHIRPGDDDPLTFWVWLEDDTAFTATASRYVRYRVSDGTILATLSSENFEGGVVGRDDIAPGDLPTASAAPPGSCPFLIILTEAVADDEAAASGVRYVDIRRQRRAPHLSDEQQWTFHRRFQLDLETGIGLSDGQGSDPQIMLRWSDDGGHTWSNEHWVSAGRMGEYTRRAVWRQLGRSRDRVYEVTVSDPVAWAFINAYLDVDGGTS